MAALKSANKGLKGMMKTVKIQEIDNLQDDMMDLMEVSDEIQEFLGRSYNVSDDIDEEDLMGELDALEADMGFETEDEGVPSYLQPDNEPDYDDELNLPSAPTGHAIPARKVNNHTVHLFTFIMDHGITWEAASELLNEKQKDVSGSSANGFYDSKREWLGRRHFLLAIEGSVGTFKILRPAIVETLRRCPSWS